MSEDALRTNVIVRRARRGDGVLVDFPDPRTGESLLRVCVELDRERARRLAHELLAALGECGEVG